MELGETPEESVVRELYEETKATLHPSSLAFYMIGSLPDISEVYSLWGQAQPNYTFRSPPQSWVRSSIRASVKSAFMVSAAFPEPSCE
jgi:8-oxo-dGTP pyrophosphatase MutT (NUDIX family)